MVHAYLLFRGQDIKDLHVHEKTTIDVPPATATTAATTTAKVGSNPPPPTNDTQTLSTRESKSSDTRITEDIKQVVPDELEVDKTKGATDKRDAPSKATNNNSGANKEPKKASSTNGGAARKNQIMVGSGASLLNRKARGGKRNQGACSSYSSV
jgi:hypothetical protein